MELGNTNTFQPSRRDAKDPKMLGAIKDGSQVPRGATTATDGGHSDQGLFRSDDPCRLIHSSIINTYIKV